MDGPISFVRLCVGYRELWRMTRCIVMEKCSYIFNQPKLQFPYSCFPLVMILFDTHCALTTFLSWVFSCYGKCYVLGQREICIAPIRNRRLALWWRRRPKETSIPRKINWIKGRSFDLLDCCKKITGEKLKKSNPEAVLIEIWMYLNSLDLWDL